MCQATIRDAGVPIAREVSTIGSSRAMSTCERTIRTATGV